MIRQFFTYAGIALCLGLLFFAGQKAREVVAAAERDRQAQLCSRSVREGESGLVMASKTCDLAIASAAAIAVRALACEKALGASNLYGERASCSEAVKGIAAAGRAATAQVADLQAQLTNERAGRAKALQSAEARGRLDAERKARAIAAVAAAPRDGDGLIVCDADCMRDRWGQADAGR